MRRLRIATNLGVAAAAALLGIGAPGALGADSPRIGDVSFASLDVYWDSGKGSSANEDGQAPILQSPTAQKERKKIVAGLCAMAKERFVAEKGEAGRGLFAKVRCIDPAIQAEENLQPEAPWRLYATGEGDRLVLRLDYVPKDGPAAPLAAYTIQSRELSGDLLDDKPYRSRLARVFYQKMPADYAMPPGQKAPKGAPKKLLRFRLQFDRVNRVWLPMLVEPEEEASGEGAREPVLGYDPARSAARSNKQAQDLAAYEEKAAKKIESSYLRRLSGLIIDQVSAGYLGLRYGRILVDRSNVLLNKVRQFALVGEFRSGPLSGLRFYYDQLPTVHATEENLEESFGWRRLLIGWGFGFQFPWLIDRVELVPKIGRWNFDANIPVDIGDGTRELRAFTLNKGLSFGAEAALEKFSARYLVRAWAARDFSASFLRRYDGDGSTVTSTRTGIDALIGGPRMPFLGVDFKLAFLLYGMNDHFSIEGNRSGDEGGGRYKITIDAPFVGGGVALAW